MFLYIPQFTTVITYYTITTAAGIVVLWHGCTDAGLQPSPPLFDSLLSVVNESARVFASRCLNSSRSRMDWLYLHICNSPQIPQSTGFRSGELGGLILGPMKSGVSIFSKLSSCTVSRARICAWMFLLPAR